MDTGRNPNRHEREALSLLSIKPVITRWDHRVYSRLWRSGWAKADNAAVPSGHMSKDSFYTITDAGRAALARAEAA